VTFLNESLPASHIWWRIADPAWRNPLDTSFAQQQGGRWNPPGSFATLYLNEDWVTARLNLRHFIAHWPYEPEDLREDTGPTLVGARLPRRQVVCDVHSRRGIVAANLPTSYPFDKKGRLITHAQCQPIGARVKQAGLRGVRACSAQSGDGAGRELAWFPANVRSMARHTQTLTFEGWYWG